MMSYIIDMRTAAPAPCCVLLLRVCPRLDERSDGGGVQVAGSHVEGRVACSSSTSKCCGSCP